MALSYLFNEMAPETRSLMEFNLRSKEKEASSSFRNKIFEPVKRFSAKHIIIKGTYANLQEQSICRRAAFVNDGVSEKKKKMEVKRANV